MLLPVAVDCPSREDPLLCLPLFSSSTSSRSRWLSVGGCFAVVLLWRMLCRRRRWLDFFSGGCFAAVVDWSGGCFATLIVLRIFAPLAM